ncbi:MAG: hypothetical protein NT116_00535 [Candidatus Parcubacteria bacterium]|nr:hypothetical protein [Candidatus Parcubacteria bacterium]
MDNQNKARQNRAKIKNRRLKLENKLLKIKLAFHQKIEEKISKNSNANK